MSYLKYSDHARERMTQRDIDEYDINEVIEHGSTETSESNSDIEIYMYNSLRVVFSKKDNVVITTFRSEHFDKRQTIETLQIEADELASLFKSLYIQASEAYAAGYKADAKALSLHGKAVQYECEYLNQVIHSLY